MTKFTFSYLDKSKKTEILPQLFDLLYENMRAVAPGEKSYEEEKCDFLSAVSPALEKAPRNVILFFADGKIIGYCQYYTRSDMLMIEELQLSPAFQRSTLLCSFVRFMAAVMPGGISFIEAYADRRNTASLNIMKKLGMAPLGENDGPGLSPLVHLRGDFAPVKCFFRA